MSELPISIIIVNYNTKHFVSKCISSIYEKFDPSLGFEVIVADNASTDGSVEHIRKNFPNVILIENKNNKGFGAANNRAVSASRGDYILLLNSDAYLIDDSLKNLYFLMEEDANIGAVGCKLLNTDNSVQPSTGKALSPTLPLPASRLVAVS